MAATNPRDAGDVFNPFAAPAPAATLSRAAPVPTQQGRINHLQHAAAALKAPASAASAASALRPLTTTSSGASSPVVTAPTLAPSTPGGGSSGVLSTGAGAPGGPSPTSAAAAASTTGLSTGSTLHKTPLGVDQPPSQGFYYPPEHVDVGFEATEVAAGGAGTLPPTAHHGPHARGRAGTGGGEVTFASGIGSVLRGETAVFTDIACYFKSPLGARIVGHLAATTYRVTFSFPINQPLPAGAPPGTMPTTVSSVAVPPATVTSALPFSMRHLHPSFFTAPLGMIRKIEKSTPKGPEAGTAFFVEVSFKDCRSWTLGFRDEVLAERVAGHLAMVAFPHRVDLLHCFAEANADRAVAAVAGGSSTPAAAAAAAGSSTSSETAASPTAAAAASASSSSSGGSAGAPTPVSSVGVPQSTLSPLPGWDAFNPYQELERMGVLHVRHPRTGELLWRVCDANREYEFCPTYPSVLVFPDRIGDGLLPSIGAFRSKARVPALTWMHPVNKTTIWRCSQPRVGMGNTCKEDEALLMAIRDANVYARDPGAPLLIADCRPQANALANKAAGWGYENYSFAQLEFLGIHNIHAVRDAYKRLEALALASNPSDTKWASSLAETGWLHHTRSVLAGALYVAEAMHRRGQSVVVHCSDGWDRTAQICGLVQILLDPYYRTLRGLCSLIAKEWASFGFKYHERQGHANRKNDTDGDCSPIFVQWLDALYQLVRLFPGAFEYNARALLLIAHHSYSCRFGTFLFDCERQRTEARLQHRCHSLWGYMLHPSRVSALVNGAYDPSRGDVLLPHPAAVLRAVDVWGDWFYRWSTFPTLVVTVSRLERYPALGYDHARVRAACVTAAGAAAAAAAAAGSGSAGTPGVTPAAAAARSPAPSATAAPPVPPLACDPLTGAPLEEASPVASAATAAPPAAAAAAPAAASSPEEEASPVHLPHAASGFALDAAASAAAGASVAEAASEGASPAGSAAASAPAHPPAASVDDALAALAAEQATEGRASPSIAEAVAEALHRQAAAAEAATTDAGAAASAPADVAVTDAGAAAASAGTAAVAAAAADDVDEAVEAAAEGSGAAPAVEEVTEPVYSGAYGDD